MSKSKEKVEKTEIVELKEFHFPAYSVTFLAADIQEAEEKLQVFIKNNSQ